MLMTNLTYDSKGKYRIFKSTKDYIEYLVIIPKMEFKYKDFKNPNSCVMFKIFDDILNKLERIMVRV